MRTEADDEVIDFLKQYGSISKCERIDEPSSAFHHSIVVEYNSGAALAALRPMLPYIYICDDVSVTYEIQELSMVCADEVGAKHMEAYLSELQKVAKLTGQDFAMVLNGAISLLGQKVTQLHPLAIKPDSPPEGKSSKLPLVATVPVEASVFAATITTGSPTDPAGYAHTADSQQRTQPDPTTQQGSGTSLPAMSHANLNPPDVQQYVHIIKNEDHLANFSQQRLRSFSGRSRPQNETDYDTWRSGVELLIKDPAVSDLERSRRVLESLLPPATITQKNSYDAHNYLA